MDVELVEGPSMLAGEHLPVRTMETVVMEGLEHQRACLPTYASSSSTVSLEHNKVILSLTPLPFSLLFQ